MTKSGTPFRRGTVVEHPKRPKWGPGKVLAVNGPSVTVYFRDAPEDRVGQALKKIDTSLAPLQKCKKQSDPFLDNLPPFDGNGFASTKPRVSLEKGMKVFTQRFPKGFEDPAYLGGKKKGERDHKFKAHQLFVDTLADGQGEDLLEDGNLKELRKRVLAVQRATNLVYPTEAAAFAAGLKDDVAATRYFTALLKMVKRPLPSQMRFKQLAAAAHALPAEGKKKPPSKWTVVTLLPFLAQPGTHIFVKPTSTQQCCDRMRFNVLYKPQPNWVTYRKVLSLSHLLLRRLEPLGAKDMIDVQSFMFVVAGYDGDKKG